jgi:VCBS repeat protein
VIKALQYLRPVLNCARASASLAGLSFFLVSAQAGHSQVTAPQVTAIALTSPSPLSAGADLTYTFSVTTGTYPIISIAIDVVDPNGYDYLIAGNLYGGTISYPTSTYWVNGGYTVSDIHINDGHSDTEYDSNGSVTNSAGETVGTTNPLTSALDFTLNGGAISITGATVTAFTPLESNSLRAIGSTLVFNFGLNFGTRNEVTELDLLVQDAHGGQENLLAVGNLTGSQVVFPLSGLTKTGAYTVLGLSIGDGYGFESFSAVYGASAIHETPGTGNIDFSSLGFILTPPGDINDDGDPDIFFMNTSTGVCGAYLMNGTSVSGWASLGSVPAQWRIAAVADFTGDGKNDILWQNTATGECGFYIMNGTTVTGWTELGTFPLVWKAVGAGDFEGNGNNDILWQNISTGECGFYLMNGTTVTGWAELGTVPTQWNIKAAADFNNDGKPDILWQNSSTGQVGIYLMNGTAVTGWASLGTVPAGWQAAGAGDFQGNGNNDIIWQNTNTGECGLYLMTGTTVSGWDEIGTVPLAWQIQY